MSLLMMRAAILAQSRGPISPPPPGLYEPPSADGILLAFGGEPFSPPVSDAVTLIFGETSHPPGPYAPPEASDITLTVPDAPDTPPDGDDIILEF